jgi:hypothetical protein
MGCLYSLTSPSGKRYLGITLKTVEQRFVKHVEHALGKRENGVLYSALRKYKPEAFKVETLVIANDWEYLCYLEKKAIVAFKTKYPSGYNMTDGGEGVVRTVLTDSARANISRAQRARYARPEQRDKLLAYGRKGQAAVSEKWSQERIDGKAKWQRLARAKRARAGSPEHRAKISKAVKATMAKPEVKAILVSCAKQRASSLEWRQKVGAAKRGHLYGRRSAEFIAKQVAGTKAAWADPVKKAARIAKNRLARLRRS